MMILKTISLLILILFVNNYLNAQVIEEYKEKRERALEQQRNDFDHWINGRKASIDSFRQKDEEEFRKFLKQRIKEFDEEQARIEKAINSICDNNDLSKLKHKTAIIEVKHNKIPVKILKNNPYTDTTIYVYLSEDDIKRINNKNNENIPVVELTNDEIKLEIEANRPVYIPLPRNSYRISSYFDLNRIHPILRIRRPHRGIDLASREGTIVFATADGIVSVNSRSNTAVNWLVIDHQNGYQTAYMHLQRIVVKKGDRVKKGDIIGYVGNTGLSTGPHLHYEVRRNRVAINPYPFMQRYFN